MKTSYSRAWECEPLTYVFFIFRLTYHMYIRVHIHSSYTQYWASNILSKVQAPLQQVRHQHESVGNGEEGMRQLGRYMRIKLYGNST